MESLSRKMVNRLLQQSGVAINGKKPWDIQVHHRRFFNRVLMKGSLGFGESYVDGDWDAEQLDSLFRRLMDSNAAKSSLVRINRAWLDLKSRLVNLQSRKGSLAIAETHYDLDHRLYEQFLGPWNQYTCCFFNQASTLEQAETEKLEMVCNKLDIQPDDRVLDIGCGWGGFARYASSSRGCRVTGISISREQIAYARKYVEGLPVEIIESDYRDLPKRFPAGHFDKIVIIGMIEHVGYRNYRRLFEIIHRLLAESGLFLLHTIGNRHVTTVVEPWIEKYIFRNSMAPAMSHLAAAAEDLFVIQDWENYGRYYARTLAAWREKFLRNWDRIADIPAQPPFDAPFRRMFDYYFQSCKAAFETDNLFLWHLVMNKTGFKGSVYPRVNQLNS